MSRTVVVKFPGNRQQAKQAIAKVYRELASGSGQNKMRMCAAVAGAFFNRVYVGMVAKSRNIHYDGQWNLYVMQSEKQKEAEERLAARKSYVIVDFASEIEGYSEGGEVDSYEEYVGRQVERAENRKGKIIPDFSFYLAYQKGPPEDRMGTGQSPNNRKGAGSANRGLGPGTGYLDDNMLLEWWNAYIAMARKKPEFEMQLSHTREELARRAWGHLASEHGGYSTKYEELGRRPYRILYDTGALIESFKPTSNQSQMVSNYNPRAHQVYEMSSTYIECGTEVHGYRKDGTKVYYAACHHFNTNPRHRRRFWPSGALGSDWIDEVCIQPVIKTVTSLNWT